jgi:hypothetical protein
MATLADRIQEALGREPGLSDRELADRLIAPGAAPQQVNQNCHYLESRRILLRRPRPDGRIGNYLLTGAGAGPTDNHRARRSNKIKVADEVWIATALLHREQPDRGAFSVAEIVDRAHAEHLTDTLRPGVQIHGYVHCVANKRPSPGNYRMLYATRDGSRRLFREGDDFHPYREGGKMIPRREDVPAEYTGLLEWYEKEYNRGGAPCEAETVTFDSEPGSIWDRIRRIWSGLPQEERRKLPVDGAEHHDHYIYGLPKK